MKAGMFLKACGRTAASIAGVIALLVAAAFLFYWFDPQQMHVRQLKRISNPMQRDINALHAGVSPATHLHGDDRARAELLMAMNTATWNELYYHNRCSPEKIRAMADRLDKTKGAELQTVEGCLRLMAEMEVACPTVKDYAWFVSVREMQDEGVIPRLRRSH